MRQNWMPKSHTYALIFEFERAFFWLGRAGFRARKWARQACRLPFAKVVFCLRGVLVARQACSVLGTSGVLVSVLKMLFFREVKAAWKWFNFHSNRGLGCKQILRINLDETSICLFQGAGKGNVFVAKKRRVLQFVPRRKRRTCFTHVALICDSSELQILMPQFLIGNDRTFPARSMMRMRSACPPNIVLLRQKSAWNNANLCARIIRRLAASIEHLRDRFQPVLLMDASRIHCARVVLTACNACGIWTVMVPPSLTWLVQPLDTHVFARYKHWLRLEFQRVRCETEQADLTIEGFLPCVYGAIRHALQGAAWASAFDENGFGAHQARISKTVRGKLNEPFVPSSSHVCPTEAEIGLCFPRRSVVPHDILRQQFRAAGARPPLPNVASASASAHVLPRGAPLVLRSSWVRSAGAARVSQGTGPRTRSQGFNVR